MITATEALKITKANDNIASELEMIEKEIHICASRGDFSTWWYTERLTDNQNLVLSENLRTFGYYVKTYTKQKKIYISWRER